VGVQNIQKCRTHPSVITDALRRSHLDGVGGRRDGVGLHRVAVRSRDHVGRHSEGTEVSISTRLNDIDRSATRSIAVCDAELYGGARLSSRAWRSGDVR
jgi:hypothetical protein